MCCRCPLFRILRVMEFSSRLVSRRRDAQPCGCGPKPILRGPATGRPPGSSFYARAEALAAPCEGTRPAGGKTSDCSRLQMRQPCGPGDKDNVWAVRQHRPTGGVGEMIPLLTELGAIFGRRGLQICRSAGAGNPSEGGAGGRQRSMGRAGG